VVVLVSSAGSERVVTPDQYAEGYLVRTGMHVDYACPNCGERGLPSMVEGVVCRLCGEEAREPFRAGWDESD
jgi:predicted RNA-binding Zn-ribbon protein involved in translation (DUF1610 family)